MKRAIKKDREAKVTTGGKSSYDSCFPKGAKRICLLKDRLARIYRCPVGDGNAYRDVVGEALKRALDFVIDIPLVRKEVRIDSGRCDLELPLKTEVFGDFYQWQYWHTRYDLRSLLVEVKNENHPASVEAVRQLGSYLSASRLGRLGLLVSRKGFSEDAIALIRHDVRYADRLILPLDEAACEGLLKARQKGPGAATKFLRRIETFSLRDCPAA